MGMEKNYKVDLEKGLKIISVLGSTTGDALRAFCYDLDRNDYRIKLTLEHPEAAEVIHQISKAKIIMIEDIKLTATILMYNNQIKVYDNMDIYYAFFDTLAKCVKGSVRLTQEGWNDTCTLQTRVSFPRNSKGPKIELREGVMLDGKNKKRAFGKVLREDIDSLIDKNFKGTVTGLFAQVFKDITGAYIFWDMDNIFGIMLDDYKIIPLKVNEATYDKVCSMFDHVRNIEESE